MINTKQITIYTCDNCKKERTSDQGDCFVYQATFMRGSTCVGKTDDLCPRCLVKKLRAIAHELEKESDLLDEVNNILADQKRCF